MATKIERMPVQHMAVESPPPIAQYSHLKPSNLLGGAYLLGCSSATAAAIWLSLSDVTWVWLGGQVLLAFAMLQWFVLIHEAGHKTLFKNSTLNKFGGHLASLLAGIPFACWKSVHAIHHRWTGWQDLDATTETLVPRRLKFYERLVINTCWLLWIPLFSLLYRWQNYWNLPRLYTLFKRRDQRLRITSNLVGLLLVYVAVGVLLGGSGIVQVFGLATLLSLMMQDILILSQHTHVPMTLSDGEDVAPYSPAEQEVFTRSLKFPGLFSRVVLLNVDAHELHHMYPNVPGYFLHRIDYQTSNEVSWWRWVWKARRVPGEVFLFQNSNHSGFDI